MLSETDEVFLVFTQVDVCVDLALEVTEGEIDSIKAVKLLDLLSLVEASKGKAVNLGAYVEDSLQEEGQDLGQLGDLLHLELGRRVATLRAAEEEPKDSYLGWLLELDHSQTQVPHLVEHVSFSLVVLQDPLLVHRQVNVLVETWIPLQHRGHGDNLVMEA